MYSKKEASYEDLDWTSTFSSSLVEMMDPSSSGTPSNVKPPPPLPQQHQSSSASYHRPSRRQSFLMPSEAGASVHRVPATGTGGSCSGGDRTDVALLLGNLSNAAAALESGVLLGYRVSHVVSVASAKRLDKVLQQARNGEPLAGASAGPAVERFFMQDWLDPATEVNPAVLAEPLAAIDRALGASLDAGLDGELDASEATTPACRAVLVRQKKQFFDDRLRSHRYALLCECTGRNEG